ncbi:putative nuclease HARBI1 isoform X2 [Coccinella septempunctata]|uniref:putative nuclease HARBI1 isoform X2 n=1 Tax=Coccinella septempunctata TaxID=41139 RepID=UPI001D06B10C|nr:putative nuclease HARBI1 isoform X2 [Coccinella septempunctata]
MASSNLIALLHSIEVLEEAEFQSERPPRIFHKRDDPFLLSDKQFIRLFRLSKDLARNLISIVSEHIVQPSRSSALDSQLKTLIALRFFATGSYQMDAASNIFLAVSQSSVSRAINEVVGVLNLPQVFNTWIHFPMQIHQLNQLRNQFYQNHGFPGVVGCIDCAHVAIFPPKVDDEVYPERIYVNRKGYHSINVQLICDTRLRILNINAKFPGSTNDAYIWQNSNINQAFVNLHRNGNTQFYLLGDSGYPLRPWLLTPLEDDPLPGSAEERYNQKHRSTRSIIERCNGLLKMRFRCLLKHRVLHYEPRVASKIINACAVLHNMCIESNIPEPEL